MYSFFKEQEHLCGFDLNLTYPQTGGYFPSLTVTNPSDPDGPGNAFQSRRKSRLTKKSFAADVNALLKKRGANPPPLKKRDLTGRSNGTIDAWYGCDLYNELVSYAVNYTYPWSKCTYRMLQSSVVDVFSTQICKHPMALTGILIMSRMAFSLLQLRMPACS